MIYVYNNNNFVFVFVTGWCRQTFAADIFFSQTWQDYRLRFPDNLTADYRLLPTSWLNSMWRPDSFFKNAKKVTFQDVTIPNHYISLYKDKSILYMVKLVFYFVYFILLALYTTGIV
jgi:hypothetical protein